MGGLGKTKRIEYPQTYLKGLAQIIDINKDRWSVTTCYHCIQVKAKYHTCSNISTVEPQYAAQIIGGGGWAIQQPTVRAWSTCFGFIFEELSRLSPQSMSQTSAVRHYLLGSGLWVSGCGGHHGGSCHCPAPAESVWCWRFFWSPDYSSFLQGCCNSVCRPQRWVAVAEWSGIQPEMWKENSVSLIPNRKGCQ